MKRLLLALLGLLAACTQAAPSSGAQLAGPNAITLTIDSAGNRNVLVSSSDRDELRVLSLTPEPRSFVRAPNPLFPLAIPTARFPRSVVSYTRPDASAGSPLSFALSTAASQVSVINTDGLSLIGSFAVPDTALAIAQVVPAGQTFRVVIAVAQGDQGALYVADIPDTVIMGTSPLSDVKPVLQVNLGRSRPQALMASPTNPDLVIVGDRLTGADGLGRSGGFAIVELSTGKVTRLDVGGPVNALTIDPAGLLAFGSLDSEACAAALPCNGVFAASLSARELRPAPGVAPMPIPGAVRGISAAGTATIAGQVLSPAVLVASTTGNLYVIDGGNFRVLDVNPSAPAVASITHFDPTGATVAGDSGGPADAVGSEGATRSEQVKVTYEGLFPGLAGRSGRPASSAIEDDVDFPALGVAPGDLVQFGTTRAGCTEATVSGVARGRLALGTFDTSCLASPTPYTVRAIGSYLVTGSLSGVMGRATASAAFTSRQTGPSGPALKFTLGAGDPRRDAGYLLTLEAGVTPFTIPVDPNTLPTAMPSALTFDPIRAHFYAAYQGGNAVVEINPPSLVHNSGTAGLTILR